MKKPSKVVLFCGGQGLRLREAGEDRPKPMMEIGQRPILWHVMKYYAHYGYRDFILCLGYRGRVIKDYFLNYDECISNDFTLGKGGEEIRLFNRDIADWNITFVDTGLHTNIGGRLMAVREHLGDAEYFFANYADGLTDFHLPRLVDLVEERDATAGFLCVRPPYSFHAVSLEGDDRVTGIRDSREAGIWINGGYFVLRRDIFDYMEEGEELVLNPFSRLIDAQKLCAFRHQGFWACMDTFKDKTMLDQLCDSGNRAPWEVWKE